MRGGIKELHSKSMTNWSRIKQLIQTIQQCISRVTHILKWNRTLNYRILSTKKRLYKEALPHFTVKRRAKSLMLLIIFLESPSWTSCPRYLREVRDRPTSSTFYRHSSRIFGARWPSTGRKRVRIWGMKKRSGEGNYQSYLQWKLLRIGLHLAYSKSSTAIAKLCTDLI